MLNECDKTEGRALEKCPSMLTPTFRKRSPTILRADIRADGVRGVVPLLLGGMPETGKEHNHLPLMNYNSTFRICGLPKSFSSTSTHPCSKYTKRKMLTSYQHRQKNTNN